MAARTKDRTRASRRHWLGGGEMCPFCLQVYVLEMEWRCCGCDRPLCPSCMDERREAGVDVCVGCEEEDPDEGSQGEGRRREREATRQDPP